MVGDDTDAASSSLTWGAATFGGSVGGAAAAVRRFGAALRGVVFGRLAVALAAAGLAAELADSVLDATFLRVVFGFADAAFTGLSDTSPASPLSCDLEPVLRVVLAMNRLPPYEQVKCMRWAGLAQMGHRGLVNAASSSRKNPPDAAKGGAI
ncbi:hypothetical protein [Paracoccus fistulariae]|uniref:hypothetical protein n=1 Tax=Paracoccus fistulariae TaxID=658446 RepID=UPI0023307A1F|nr:hypothetical protein [Paracoccus fistulariae]MDB6180510.1 hypothetical protein [Paracoccus fistulariae]